MKEKETENLEYVPLVAGQDIIVNEKYRIQNRIQGDNLILKMGVRVNPASDKFSHPKVLRMKDVHEFKSWHPKKGKSWYAHAGYNLILVVPLQHILIGKWEGCSFVKARINGVDITLSVSGGTCDEGWADWFGGSVCTLVGYPIRKIKQIAEVAVEWEFPPFEPLPPEKEEQWNKLARKGDGRKDFVQRWRAGEKPTIHLARFKTFGSGEETAQVSEVAFFRNKNDYNKETNRIFKIYAYHNGYQYHMKPSDIDWKKTMELNAGNKETA
jgi:hypothetical protein